jgi:peroxiredoxin
MKKLMSFAFASIAAAIIGIAEVKIGKPAPDFAVKDINGKTQRLSDYQGKIVVIEAINLDSPFCANQYASGAMQSLQAAVTSKGGVWLIVSTALPGQPGHRTPEAARKEFAARNIKATAWLDDATGVLTRLYGIQTTPQAFVVDGQGLMAYQGAIDDRPSASGDPRTARNHVKQAVEALMAGKPVPVPETKPYGTQVKSAN